MPHVFFKRIFLSVSLRAFFGVHPVLSRVDECDSGHRHARMRMPVTESLSSTRDRTGRTPKNARSDTEKFPFRRGKTPVAHAVAPIFLGFFENPVLAECLVAPHFLTSFSDAFKGILGKKRVKCDRKSSVLVINITHKHAAPVASHFVF